MPSDSSKPENLRRAAHFAALIGLDSGAPRRNSPDLSGLGTPFEQFVISESVQQRMGSYVFRGHTADRRPCVLKFFVARDPANLKENWHRAWEAGLVPELVAFERLSSVWCVVLMEDLCAAGWLSLSTLAPTPERLHWVEAAQSALRTFHSLGLLHGDARPTNIMVRTGLGSGAGGAGAGAGAAGRAQAPAVDSVRLIDLDWCVPAGVGARYTDQLNIVDVRRPDGAVPGALLTAEIDLAQVALF